MVAGENDASLLINEAKLLLAEKRTHLAALRTGIAILALPMGVLSLLIVLSSHWRVADALEWLVPLLLACALLAGLGGWLIWRSIRKLRQTARALDQLKRKSPVFADIGE
jgi:ABC-type nickel/cobalt efflux system permease component RcnA